MSHQAKIDWSPNADGTFDVAIRVRNVDLKPTADLKRWEMIDVDLKIPQEIEYCGLRSKARLVVRLFCKLPQSVYKKFCKDKEREELMLRSPLLRQYGRPEGIKESRLQPRHAQG